MAAKADFIGPPPPVRLENSIVHIFQSVLWQLRHMPLPRPSHFREYYAGLSDEQNVEVKLHGAAKGEGAGKK